MTTKVKRILIVEDSEQDIELTLAALEEHNVANEVDVARDGAEALDYLYRRGTFAGRSSEMPVVILLDLKMPRVDGIEVLRQLNAAIEHLVEGQGFVQYFVNDGLQQFDGVHVGQPRACGAGHDSGPRLCSVEDIDDGLLVES